MQPFCQQAYAYASSTDCSLPYPQLQVYASVCLFFFFFFTLPATHMLILLRGQWLVSVVLLLRSVSWCSGHITAETSSPSCLYSQIRRGSSLTPTLNIQSSLCFSRRYFLVPWKPVRFILRFFKNDINYQLSPIWLIKLST